MERKVASEIMMNLEKSRAQLVRSKYTSGSNVTTLDKNYKRIRTTTSFGICPFLPIAFLKLSGVVAVAWYSNYRVIIYFSYADPATG